jgi:uncharacterized protein
MADAAPLKACPICGKPVAARFSPFCSRRCVDVDLNRWLSGVYVVPTAADEEGDGDGQQPADDTAGRE